MIRWLIELILPSRKAHRGCDIGTAMPWKLKYQDTRKQLLEARVEIYNLKQRLKNGDWHE